MRPDEARRTILCVIGTRPEAIKMAPVILALQRANWARCRVVLSGQHRDLVRPILDLFEIDPDLDLDVMRPNQPLPELTARMMTALSRAMADERPDFVLAQGDTTTVMVSALVSFYSRVPFGHVEAGLRTNRLDSPFPEEGNRVVAGHLGSVHFAPTRSARANLVREGIRPDTIHVTGNTVIDALKLIADRDDAEPFVGLPGPRRILITAHRRESLGLPLLRICKAVRILHERHPDVEFLWPVHPNPAIRPVVQGELGRLERIKICEPLSYEQMVSAMRGSTLILTDSGGIQEEAPALGKPVLVLRSESERPEAISAGVARLVGTETRRIVAETSRLLNDDACYRAMGRGASPYGDGRAAARIVAIVAKRLRVTSDENPSLRPAYSRGEAGSQAG